MIAIRDLRKAYQFSASARLEVLKSLNLTIDAGEFVAIMGPSGSGKSTLLNVIACLDRFDGGQYRFRGQDVATLDKDQLANLRLQHIGFVFQSFNLIAQLSAQANVAMPLQYSRVPRDERRQRAEAQLRALGLGERIDHKPAELSGGQQQRVAIARALINEPDVLIADEPTGSLDTETGDDIMRLFQTVNERGVTIVMVTHEEDVAARAGRIVRMRDGHITDNGRHG